MGWETTVQGFKIIKASVAVDSQIVVRQAFHVGADTRQSVCLRLQTPNFKCH